MVSFPQRRLRSSIALACLFVPGIARSAFAQPARRPAGNPFGIHGPSYSHWAHDKLPFTWERGDAKLRVLDDTGCGWVRQDFWWGLVEPEPGRFVWDDFDRAVDSYTQHGFNVLAILCYSSAWSSGVCPDTDEERARFGEYVYQMVKRYHGRIAAWEIWNEPNIQPYWSPRPDPALYAKLLQVAYRRAKEADPQCIIVGGALAGPDVAFLRGMCAAGAADHFDALSYHNYGQQLDITTEWPDVERLRGVLAEHGMGQTPIWQTETGFYTGPAGLSEADQAARIVRYSVGLLALGLERTFQLALADWSDDPQSPDPSIFRGLTHADFAPKPAFRAYQTLCRRLADMHFVGQVRPAPGVWGFLFERDRESERSRDRGNGADPPTPLPSGERLGEGPSAREGSTLPQPLPAREGSLGTASRQATRGAACERVLVLWGDWGVVPEKFTPLDLGVPVVLWQDVLGGWGQSVAANGLHALPVTQAPLYVINPGPPVLRQVAVRWPGAVHTPLARQADVVVPVQLNVPTTQPARLTLLLPAHEATAQVAPGATQVDLRIDAAHLPVGTHDWAWELAGADGSSHASGYWRFAVANPLSLAFDRFNHLDAQTPALPVRVRYVGKTPTQATLTLALDSTNGAPVPVQLAPGADTPVQLPLDVARLQRSAAPTALNVALEADGLALSLAAQRRLTPITAAPTAFKVDGDLAEWRDRPPTIQPAQLRWEYVGTTPAPEDLQVTGWVAYDAAGLCFALEVRDDLLALPEGRAVWNWDSVQLALDLGSDGQPDVGYDGNDLEIELGRGRDGTPWCYLGYCPPGWPQEELSRKLVGAVQADATAGVIRYELRVPAELLVSILKLAPDTVLGYSLLVNDNDGAGRAGWQELTPGIGMGKMPEKFDWLWLR